MAYRRIVIFIHPGCKFPERRSEVTITVYIITRAYEQVKMEMKFIHVCNGNRNDHNIDVRYTYFYQKWTEEVQIISQSLGR